ncbi:Acyl-CoA dehydrogenase domain protein [Parafrankia sp. Ea1.12]|uniref:acyl-CoA dehydrogenase family protein n=1 Tax=Parafrankia sp. Ea1.12 TaxID=573499 RepID=UPI000DA5108D|nr:acyl-CoA dehydrogenase family protein [Parafrankia sp. Ea1.12]SQD95420.1 Acyl-CoA dehydrogenase domain protein [Parafrankia sp. Ea1.12]
MDAAERELLTETFRKAMTGTTGAALDTALTDLGWPELLTEEPDTAIPVVFTLLGETGAHAPILNDVLLHATGQPLGGTLPLPYTGGTWLTWERTDPSQPSVIDPALPLHTTSTGDPNLPLAAGQRALGWWLLGTGRTMLALTREHALARTQFGRPIASFQAVRHRLAETLVALDGAEATLHTATTTAATTATDAGATTGTGTTTGDIALTALLAKAAAGKAALDAARHCQQVLAGIGFTAEHDFHHHLRRTLTLDGLLGSTRDLTRQAGAHIRQNNHAPRLVNL